MITEEQEAKLRELLGLFLEENKKLNLSAFRTEENCWNGNVLDSVAAAELDLFMKEGLSVLDVGTGGGFPLLPLAILLPQQRFVGMDATKKKIDAVQRIMEALHLTNVSLVTGRAEELGQDPAHRQQYDIVLSRAVAPINVLLELCAPFAKVGGRVIFWKSMKIDGELQESLLARAELSCRLVDRYEYDLDATGLPTVAPAKRGGGWGKRQLLIYEKQFATKEKYPRAVGVPAKHPLV